MNSRSSVDEALDHKPQRLWGNNPESYLMLRKHHPGYLLKIKILTTYSTPYDKHIKQFIKLISEANQIKFYGKS